MQIREKVLTNNEFLVQLEDWHEDFASKSYTVAAYPKGNWRCRFRAWCDFDTMEEAQAVFDQLRNGEKTVFDFSFVATVPGGRHIPMVEKMKREGVIL
jgi:hypothetical protein